MAMLGSTCLRGPSCSQRPSTSYARGTVSARLRMHATAPAFRRRSPAEGEQCSGRERLRTQASLGNPSDACSEWSHQGHLHEEDLDAQWQAFIAPNAERYHQPHQRQQGAGPGPGSTAAATCPSNLNSSGRAVGGGAVRSLDDWDFDDDVYTPYPSNTPVNEAGGAATLTGTADVLELWTFAERQAAPALDMRNAVGRWEGLSEVFVILFGVGQSETEGIYSLRAAADDGMPTETIIAFESKDDAQRYAVHLEATMLPMMDHAPSVCSIPPSELLNFCEEANYRCSLEPAGSLLMPPDYNVGITDWERSLRLREGHYSVLEEDPVLPSSTGSSEWDSDAQPYCPLRPDTPVPAAPLSSSSNMLWLPNELVPRVPSEFSAQELASIRARLEALLPDDCGPGDGDFPPVDRIGM